MNETPGSLEERGQIHQVGVMAEGDIEILIHSLEGEPPRTEDEIAARQRLAESFEWLITPGEEERAGGGGA